MSNSKLIEGNTLDILSELESDSIDLVITSPPYYLLRDYKDKRQLGSNSLTDYFYDLGDVFYELRRVLKNTGSFYFNISDTTVKGQMLMIPETLCKMLVDDYNFIKRKTIIWHKPSVLPQGKANYTSDFEYVYYFVKSKKFTWNPQYEPMTYEYKSLEYNGKATKDYKGAKAQDPSESKRRILKSYKKFPEYGGNKYPDQVGGLYSGKEWKPNEKGMRVKRAVWKISVKPFKGAHFATFPPELVETPILASSNPGDTILDPFCGTGTVGLVCQKYNRNFIGIDLDVSLAKQRLGLNYTHQSP